MAGIRIQDQLKPESQANTEAPARPAQPQKEVAPTPVTPLPIIGQRRTVDISTTGDNQINVQPNTPQNEQMVFEGRLQPEAPQASTLTDAQVRAGERNTAPAFTPPAQTEFKNPVGTAETAPAPAEPVNPVGASEATPPSPQLIAAIEDQLKQRYTRGGQMDPGLFEAAAEQIAAEVHAKAPYGYEEYLTGEVLARQMNAHADQVDAEFQKARGQAIAYFSTIGKGNASREEIDAYVRQHMENVLTVRRAEDAAGQFIGEKVAGAFNSAPGQIAMNIFDTLGRATIDGILGTFGIGLQKAAELAGGGRGTAEQVTTEAVQAETKNLPPVVQQLANVILYPAAASETMRIMQSKDPWLQEHSVDVGPVRIDPLTALEVVLPATGIVGAASKIGKIARGARTAEQALLDAEQIMQRIGQESRWAADGTGQLVPGGPLVQRNSILGDTFAKRAEQVAANRGEITAEQALHRDLLAAEVAKRGAQAAPAPESGGLRATIAERAKPEATQVEVMRHETDISARQTTTTVGAERTSGSLMGKFLGGEAGSSTIEHATGVKYIKAAADVVRRTLGSHQAVDISSHIDDLHISNNPLAEEQVWTAAKEGATWGRPTVSAEKAAEIRALPTKPEYVQAALDAWNDLTPGVKNVGKGWYQIARDDIAAAAQSSGRFTPKQVAGVYAAMSPNKSWDSNSRMALAAIGDWIKNGDNSMLPKGLQYPENLRKAEDILAGVDPEVVLNRGAARGTGRKVLNFYKNLSGDVGEVTIDRHMATFFGVPFKQTGYTTKARDTYTELANAIKQAALEAGVNPEQMQAGLWHYVRPSEGMAKTDSARYAAPSIKSIKAASETVAEMTNKNDGATFSLTQGDLSGKPLFSVGVMPERMVEIEGRVSPEDIAKFIRDNADVLDEEHAVGTWFDNDKTVLDIATTTASKQEALRMGEKYGQDAIYDLAKGEVVDLKAPIKHEFFHYQDKTMESLPKQMGQRDIGKTLEDAMDIGRGLNTRAVGGYIEEKIGRVDDWINGEQYRLDRLTKPMSDADKSLAQKIAEGYQSYPGKLSPVEDAVRDLTIALTKQDIPAARSALDNVKEFFKTFNKGEGGSAKIGYALGVDAVKAAIAKAKGKGKLTLEEEALWTRIADKTAAGEVLNDTERAISARIRQFVPRSGLTAPAFGGRMASDITKEIQKVPGWEKKGISHLSAAVKSGQGLQGVPQSLVDTFTLANAQVAAKQFGLPVPTSLADAAKQFPQLLDAQKINAGVGAGTATQNLIAAVGGGLPQGLVKATVWDHFISVWNLPRTLRAAFDFSAPLRQGIVLSVSHPKAALGATKAMFAAFKDPKVAEDVMNTIYSSRHAKSGVPGAALVPGMPYEEGSTFHKMKLYLAPIDDAPLGVREEAFLTEWAGKIPGLKQSNRSYSVYLNKLRSDVAESVLNAAEAGGRPYELNELQALGAFINHSTGRGDLSAVWTEALGTVLYSPRFTVSRFQTIGDALAIVKQADNRGTRQAARDFAIYAGGYATMVGLAHVAHMAGADIDGGYDPRAGNFGKLTSGPQSIDLGGGFTQWIRFAFQMALGEKIGNTGQHEGEVLMAARGDTLDRFVRSKLNPQAGLAYSVKMGQSGDALRPGGKMNKATTQAYGQPFFDQPIGINYNGDVITLHDVVGAEGESLYSPMAWVDIKQAMEAELKPGGNPVRGAVAGALALFGASSNVQEGGLSTTLPTSPTSPAKGRVK